MHIPSPIKVGDKIRCVGITSRTPSDAFDPETQVKMRWIDRKGGDPATGLTKPSVAKVTFIYTLTVYSGERFPIEVAAETRGKFVRADHFQALLAIQNAYARKLAARRS